MVPYFGRAEHLNGEQSFLVNTGIWRRRMALAAADDEQEAPDEERLVYSALLDDGFILFLCLYGH